MRNFFVLFVDECFAYLLDCIIKNKKRSYMFSIFLI